jgi:hypothetical protein
LGSICYGDGVLGALFTILDLGRLGMIVVLVGVVPRRSTVDALTIFMTWLGVIVGVAVVLVVAVGFLGVIILKTILGLLSNILC